MIRLKTKLNMPFDIRDRVALEAYLKESGVVFDDVEIVRNKALTWRKNVACFSILHPDTVYVCHDQRNMLFLAPHVAHELKHREQFKRMGWLVYAILAFPLWRMFTIEPEAYAEEDRVGMELEW